MAVATHSMGAPSRAPIPSRLPPPAEIRPAASLFHEAGRLVAMWRAAHRGGRALTPCNAVSFLADPAMRGRMFGWAREDKRAGNDALARSCEEHVRVALVAAYAGPAAEARHLGVDVEEILFGVDHVAVDTAGRISADWFCDGPAAIAACDEAERVALALVSSPAGWAAIEAVAAVLQRGEGAEVERLCAEAFGT